MNTTDNTPRLKESLRQAYRSTTVSPYLSQRVLVTVKSNKRPLIPDLRLAAGLVCMALLVIFLTTSYEPDNPASPALASSVAGAFQYPSITVPDYPDTELKIPGLSSLSHVPTLSRFNTPAVSLDYPGDFCTYQQRGELSC